MGEQISVENDLPADPAGAAADETGIITVQTDKTGRYQQNIQIRVAAARFGDAFIVGDNGGFVYDHGAAFGITLTYIDGDYAHLFGRQQKSFVGSAEIVDEIFTGAGCVECAVLRIIHAEISGRG